jgi:poly(hydroxyalkanoate) granule-associated protein
MATPKPKKSQSAPSQPTAEAFAPPAQQVWLAGLGAMAKAQEQGNKAIEALLSDGLAFQRKSQAEAQQRLQEATERLGHLASGFGPSTSGRVDKLEHLFEDRVAKALHRLGMPSLLDIQMLSERVAQLESQLQALQPEQTAAKGANTKGANALRKASPGAQKAAPKASKPTAKADAPAVVSRKKSA